MNNDLEQFSEERLKDMQEHVTAGMTLGHADALLIRQVIDIALAAKQAKPLAYADKQAFKNFSQGVASKEWMWAKNDGGLQPLYTTPQPAHTAVNSPVIPDGWKLVPIEPTDEQLRLMLSARYPAAFREHLRNPLNGPKSRVEAEMLIAEVTNQYKNMLAAAPKPESE